MRIWDLHTHLNGIAGSTPEARLGKILSYADRMGIEKVCVYMGMRFLQNPTPDELREQNDEVLRAIRAHPDRAFGFVYLSTEQIQRSHEELERCVADGPMVGIKLWVAKRCNTTELDRLVSRAIELKAPIFQHTWIKTGGNFPGESHPNDLVELAERFPKATFYCGHVGGNWELGIPIIAKTPNIFGDLAGSNPTSGITEFAVQHLGADRVIYGSDACGRSFASQLAKVHAAEIDELDKQKIFCDNLRRTFLPILNAKGMNG